MPSVAGGMVLEGSSIDVNGTGLALATRPCLLDANRNPGVSVESIEERLALMLGIQQVIWLDHGLFGDLTNGHINHVARFADMHTVVVAVEQDRDDPNYTRLKTNYERLEQIALPDGKRLNLVTLSVPSPVIVDNTKMPASYTDFYVTNHSVLVPQFNQDSDEVARLTLGRLFPGRRIVGVNCLAVIHGFGSLHRLAQFIPVA